MLWKGRVGFKQFIRTKRNRFGIKVFVFCPSHADFSGYSWNFEIYYGKDSNYKITLGTEAADDPEAVEAVAADAQLAADMAARRQADYDEAMHDSGTEQSPFEP